MIQALCAELKLLFPTIALHASFFPSRLAHHGIDIGLTVVRSTGDN